MTARKGPAKRPETEATYIVFGAADGGKPRGARFSADQFEQAQQAAMSMKLFIYEARFPELAALAKKLPAGRIYARGKSFIPFIRKDLYAQLCEAANAPSDPVKPSIEAPTSEAATPSPALPRTWDEVAVGQLVLVQESRDDGWFECIVLDRKNDIVTLRWRDYPKFKPFSLHIASIALINPGPASQVG